MFAECVFSQRKSTTNFGSDVVSRGKVTISVGRETTTHNSPKKIDEHFFC